MRLSYAGDLLERVPELVAGALWVRGLTNLPADPEVERALAAAEALTHERFPQPADIARHPPIAAWRQVYSRLGLTPNRYPCAAEALIRRVVEAGQLPRVSALVDLCNVTSLVQAIPVAPFDLWRVAGDCTVRFATGAELFVRINGREFEPIPAGEVVYADDSREVLSRRWNWRQADKGKVTPATTNLLITTEAVHADARSTVDVVLAELADRIPALFGGAVQTEVFSGDQAR
ncbi:MAG TPA: phenylalanine--tRNA ligase beta subunit-related protein [Thermomicrobiaceae bacterium]|nr:phenylalanine--tRNA ligase beta subunit-related protein [Thermomicrobiaceae bacterium]